MQTRIAAKDNKARDIPWVRWLCTLLLLLPRSTATYVFYPLAILPISNIGRLLKHTLPVIGALTALTVLNAFFFKLSVTSFKLPFTKNTFSFSSSLIVFSVLLKTKTGLE